MEGGSKINTADYLARIGLPEQDIKPDAVSLYLLQRSHLFAVPFENLDIHWKRPITVDTERFYNKIVVDKRGGFCYELNGLFNELLRATGFRTRLVSARVFNGETFGPEYDHAAIIVTIGELEYLADVGFGDFSAEPLRFVPDLEQVDREGVFVIRRADDRYFEVAKKNADAWIPQYKFVPFGRDLSEFAEMCDYQQYSPESHFTKGRVCSILTANGRKTLTDRSFIVTSDGERTETPVASEADFDEILKREFRITRTEVIATSIQ